MLYKDLRQHWYSYGYHLSIIGHERFPPPCFTVVCVCQFPRHYCYLYTSFKLGSIPHNVLSKLWMCIATELLAIQLVELHIK